MKHRLLILSLILSPCLAGAIVGGPAAIADAAPPTSGAHTGVINGVVKDSTTDAPIEDAIVILQCACLSDTREAMTNARGIYQFQELPPGKYTIQVLSGMANVSKIAKLPRAAKFRANFVLDLGSEDHIEIVVDASPVVSSSSAMRIDMDSAKSLPVGVSTSRDFTTVVELAPSASRDSTRRLAGTTGNEQGPRAGTLTAGTLDDSVDDSELAAFAHRSFPNRPLEHDLGLGQRAEVIVVDAKGRPVNDAKLRVSVSGQQQHPRSVVLRTGTDGRAIVNGSWDLGVEASPSRPHSIRIVASKAGVELSKQAELGAGPVRMKLKLKRSKSAATVAALDLVLVVDTTGSMADELDWLAAELRGVVAQALADHPGIDARLGLVAYRDLGDSYVTRRFDLSTRQQDFQAFLDQQVAGGGGDYPEAVDAALAEAVQFDWRHDEKAAKVVFLVGDAPPHDARVRQTFEAISGLRAAGVSIYPVASSGVQDQAELVFRVIAADSGAQYLFLTDDSGIGNPHAAPHTDAYKVELLRDALLRILAAELGGTQASLPTPPARAAFGLETSLFDDGGARQITGGPMISFDLH